MYKFGTREFFSVIPMFFIARAHCIYIITDRSEFESTDFSFMMLMCEPQWKMIRELEYKVVRQAALDSVVEIL